MIAAIVHQLTRDLTDDQIQNDPSFAAYFVDHTAGIYPTAASGSPWSAPSLIWASISSKTALAA